MYWTYRPENSIRISQEGVTDCGCCVFFCVAKDMTWVADFKKMDSNKVNMSPTKTGPGKLETYSCVFYVKITLKCRVSLCEVQMWLKFSFTASLGMDGEEPYPSLSDYHDYEPNLEFDDTELHQTPDNIADAGKQDGLDIYI